MIEPKKSLSQNFLIDKNISKKILESTDVKNGTVLEIGPGYGFMTDTIMKYNPKKVIIIEKDFQLFKFLEKKYSKNNKIEIILGDILKYNLSKFKNLIIISNLPYNISTKIILHLFYFNKNISEMIVMVQKEVSQKFDYNLPKMNKYKFLTKIVSSYDKCFDVSPNVFIPKPKVISTVVKFRFNKKNINLEKASKFSKLIFKNVRKKIINNIKVVSDLSEKRVNEISIKDLLKIYDLF